MAEVNHDYLLLVLRGPLIQSYFATTTRTLAQPTLNVGAIEHTPIPLPPVAEQLRIVAKVDQLMALVDQLETQLAASRATAARLLEALVAELTTGSGHDSQKVAVATELKPRLEETPSWDRGRPARIRERAGQRPAVPGKASVS